MTTLRDNLIVVVQDADGNDISQAGLSKHFPYEQIYQSCKDFNINYMVFLSWAGVETKLIVEKGLWDDFFPLKGGGHVHLKLQFVLSEDERNRIRVMVYSKVKNISLFFSF